MLIFRGRPGIIVCAVWLAMIAICGAVISRYQETPGQVAETPVPVHWPAEAKVPLSKDRATLVMFAHPKCPCTRASVEELNRLLARSNGQISTHIFFLKPTETPENWTQTDLWRTAASIPGVTVHEDLNGAQNRLFGAETSGYVALYDTNGQQIFKGGITAKRGHSGDNAGASAIVSLSQGRSTSLRQTRVYGCSLVGNCEM